MDGKKWNAYYTYYAMIETLQIMMFLQQSFKPGLMKKRLKFGTL
jgi:hypothetical protein